MIEETISEQIAEILCQKFHRSQDTLEKKNWNKPLTGEPFYLTDIDMVYLLFELEKQYDKHVDSEYLDNYGFSTISKIANILGKI
jgi:acyl carrier protein